MSEIPTLKEQYGSNSEFADKISIWQGDITRLAVGPIVRCQVTDRLRQDLKNCYISCMMSALEKGIRSIAFCCISTGEFHFPNEDAAEIAVETVKEFLEKHEGNFERVIFNIILQEFSHPL